MNCPGRVYDFGAYYSWTLFYVYCCWLAGIGGRLCEVRSTRSFFLCEESTF